jgi:hypothetical protein
VPCVLHEPTPVLHACNLVEVTYVEASIKTDLEQRSLKRRANVMEHEVTDTNARSTRLSSKMSNHYGSAVVPGRARTP